MATFLAGRRLAAAQLECATVSVQQSAQGTTTSTTYTSTLTGPGGMSLVAVASAAGKLLITIGGRLWNSNPNLHNYMAYALSGAGVYTETDDDAAILFCDASTGFPSEAFIQKTTLRTGLVPFGSYTITARYKAQGFTMNCANRVIIAQPVI